VLAGVAKKETPKHLTFGGELLLVELPKFLFSGEERLQFPKCLFVCDLCLRLAFQKPYDGFSFRFQIPV
jgi:hypothetical protein